MRVFPTLLFIPILFGSCKLPNGNFTFRASVVRSMDTVDSQKIQRPKVWPHFDTTASLHFKNAFLSSVLDSLKVKTGYYFTYSLPDLDSLGSRVNINVDDISVDTILQRLAKDQKKLNFIVYPPDNDDGSGKRFVVTAKKKSL